MKLIFLTVMPSPYQRQLFAAMADAPDIEVAARYFVANAHDRQWAVPDLHPHEKVMAGITLSPLGKSAHFNFSVLSELGNPEDLVVVSDYSAPTAQIAMRALSMKRRPFVFWGEIPGFSDRGKIGSYVRGQLQSPLRAAAAIAGIGSGAVDAYQRLFPQTPVYNIPYFCDLAHYKTARAKAPPKKGKTVDVLFCGQLIARKGVDILIEAFAVAARDKSRLRLVLVGSGPDRTKFETMVPKDLKHRVIFLGHREPAELPAIFAEADVFCLPSRHDGWGVVVNEALGAGLPVLVSNAVGAGRDLVEDGVNGFITSAGDAVALADRLRRIANDDERLRLGKAAEASADRWDLSEGVARWRKLHGDVFHSGFHL